MNSAFVLSWSLHWHFSFNMEPKLCLKFGLAWDLCSTFPLHHCILREYDVCYDKQDSVFSAVCDFVVFLFVTQISRERLNRFAPNSQGRRVWFPARTTLNVKVKGQGHYGQKRAVHSHHPGNDRMERARYKWRHSAADGAIPSLPGVILAALL